MAALQTHIFNVDMTCEGCSGAVERVLNKMKDKGVNEFEISLADKKVKVTTTLSSDEVLNIIKKTGKEVQYVSSA